MHPNVNSISMDSMRDYMGIDKEGSHAALKDVKDTANIMIRFLKFHRALASKTQFEKAFADGKSYI